jgi:hypothetical protein
VCRVEFWKAVRHVGFIRESQNEEHEVSFSYGCALLLTFRAIALTLRARLRFALTFLEFFHGRDDEALGIFDLLHDEPHIHRWKLRLALAAAIDAMLADKSQRVCQNIQRRGEAASHRAHLEFVSFFGFAIMIEHDEPPL